MPLLGTLEPNRASALYQGTASAVPHTAMQLPGFSPCESSRRNANRRTNTLYRVTRINPRFFISPSTCSTFQSSAAVPSITRSACDDDGRT